MSGEGGKGEQEGRVCRRGGVRGSEWRGAEGKWRI